MDTLRTQREYPTTPAEFAGMFTTHSTDSETQSKRSITMTEKKMHLRMIEMVESCLATIAALTEIWDAADTNYAPYSIDTCVYPINTDTGSMAWLNVLQPLAE